jgi:Tol biopolymer transport system component
MNVFRSGAKEEEDLSWFDWTWVRDITRDGKFVLFNEVGEATGEANELTYIRNIESPSAVRLGEANPLEFSPDGQWVLAKGGQNLPFKARQLLLIPIGAGQSKTIARGSIEEYGYATFFPDGNRIAFAGREKAHDFRIYTQGINDASPVPITVEKTDLLFPCDAVSPDGKSIVGVKPDGKIGIYSVDGGKVRAIPGLEQGTKIIGWRNDGDALFITVGAGSPSKIYLLNPFTGKKTFWKEIGPSDPAGVTFMFNPVITPDGKSYAYSYERALSDLFLIEGLK